MVNKKWYLSKTVWVNVVATAAVIVQVITQKEIASPEVQAVAISAINVVLRAVTKENITW